MTDNKTDLKSQLSFKNKNLYDLDSQLVGMTTQDIISTLHFLLTSRWPAGFSTMSYVCTPVVVPEVKCELWDGRFCSPCTRLRPGRRPPLDSRSAQGVCKPLCGGTLGRTAEILKATGIKPAQCSFLSTRANGYSPDSSHLLLQRKDRAGVFIQLRTVASCCFLDGHVRTLILSSHSPVQVRGALFLVRKALAMLSNRRGNVSVKNQSR